jgi:hypothetical protein
VLAVRIGNEGYFHRVKFGKKIEDKKSLKENVDFPFFTKNVATSSRLKYLSKTKRPLAVCPLTPDS